MYRVIKFFTDLNDNNHAYHAGDEFPREGIAVSDERIEELAGKNNKQGVPLIEAVKDAAKADPEPKKEAKKPATKKKVVKKS